MSAYTPNAIESKWFKAWQNHRIFEAQTGSSKEKLYLLVEFPYPSAQGLHVGHPRPYTALDIVARMRRMQGYNVLFPMGWDAFGLPTENFAIKNKVPPADITAQNIINFRRQCDMMGFSFDWSREVSTTDPSYYKWTQWIFLQMFKHGLAYKTEMPVNWCMSCKCVLANEEVIDGACERCGAEVERRQKSQWMLKITAYAQRLIDDLNNVDYPERVKAQQCNWIGRSEGTQVSFLASAEAGRELEYLQIFTTRPDTLFGATYMVIAPEHPFVENNKAAIENYAEAEAYRIQAAKKSDFERTELQKEKSGVRLQGVHAVNPVNGAEIPIFISDYVLASYGTGAIMAVPGHDERDWEFAKTFNLSIVEVISGGNVQEGAYTGDGVLVNSDFLNGLSVAEAKQKATQWLQDKDLGESKVNFKLRDWVFARQRYWGEPIPIVHCPTCGIVPLPEDQLPLVLPEVQSYEPTDTGESPLSALREWVEISCPACGEPAERETDTMPQWAGSSWYFLRYCDPHNDKALASQKSLSYWTPVDWYNGGMEHTTLHLLYSRFWHKFLYDIGIAPTVEPYAKRTSHGMILAEDGEKMSKSRGNVVSPDDVVAQHGADTLRLYIMFIGDFEKAACWSSQAIKGCRRFLDRVWALQERVVTGDNYTATLESVIHKAIKKITHDVLELKYNTAIATLMALCNDMYKQKSVTQAEFDALLTLLHPFAPHITEELWTLSGNDTLLAQQSWPTYDEAKTADATVTIAVQVNGKMRGTVTLPANVPQEDAVAAAMALDKAIAHFSGRNPPKIIYVPNKIVNLIG